MLLLILYWIRLIRNLGRSTLNSQLIRLLVIRCKTRGVGGQLEQSEEYKNS